MSTVKGKKRIVGGWHHIVGVLNEGKTMELYVDGDSAGTGKAPSLIKGDPAQTMEVGADAQTAVGNYKSPMQLTGIVDEIRLYFPTAV